MKPATLNEAERRDVLLWFGWGAVLGYATDPLSYLRDALKPSHRALFLEMPRPKRKAVLRFVIEEHARRTAGEFTADKMKAVMNEIVARRLELPHKNNCK